ncbi:TlpA family protein disulfide reductase [Chitinophaga sp. 22321]|uniref:TlpA family protein disulfide reductase n=1 Tax=Chitinophaga hostae TaxID=2831022 RepID=A0ABS5J0K5_9BACT|nr:TlpA disulfide reductase family protein [Chitinophaga hostae]MBS0028724.1 TlpA family protein disulfide reductase [Chitinophaga hostae]
MSKYLLLTALFICCISSLPVAAQSTFKAHDTWLYRLEQDLDYLPNQHQHTEKVYRITIAGVNKDGSADVTAVLQSSQVTASDERSTKFNSADRETYNGNQGAMSDMFLLYRPLTFKIFANDSIGEATNTTAIAAAVGDEMGLDQQFRDMLTQNWKWLPQQMTGLLAPLVPKVEENYQWITGEWSYRVTEIGKGIVKITGSQNDHLPDSSHRLITASYTLTRNKRETIAFEYANKPGPGQPATGTTLKGRLLPAGAVLPKADTAFFKALVQMSYYSNSLTAKGEMDSTKVADFLALNIPRYGNNLAFNLARLDMPRGSTDHSYEVYNDLLQQVPSYALANSSSHLFNKLGNSVTKSIDSSMVLVKLLSAYPESLNSWLDQSFSQYLQSEKFDTTGARDEFRKRGVSEKRIAEIFEEGRKMPAASQEMIKRLVMEKDSSLQASVRPMGLWSRAMHTTDTTILKEIALEIANVTPAEMTLGKAARYELMVHDMLRKSKLDKAADVLLDKTLENLQRNQSDTAFWRAHPQWRDKKSANKNILGHAYYLKYQQTAPQDKKTALNFLALAAANAPRNNAEKAYESFYDRVFLHSEEDYNPKFAEELSAMGKPEEAMKVLSRQLMTQPDMLDQTKALFEKNFPGRSFQDYFRNVLLKEWDQAPDFTLTGLNKENYRLADYKGKWLLLDFWGSWCSPCRADLPHLNQLAAEINAGSHPGNAILAISCRESMETARDFVADNKYVFPAAHSDGKIENLYKVRGYPTKVLVSPDGKMLDLQFGADYAAILRSYSDLYFKEDKTATPVIKVDNKKKD